MIVAIDDKLISTEVFDRKFVCDLNACKGACCVEGDGGAPLTLEEVDIMEEILDDVIPFMRPEGIEAVEKSGVFYIDPWNEPATTLINGKECAFVYFEGDIAKCAIEKAYFLIFYNMRFYPFNILIVFIASCQSNQNHPENRKYLANYP